jgi:hypothetical protein
MSFAVQVILDWFVYFGSILVFQILFSNILLSMQRWAGLEECRHMLNISSYLQLVCNFSLSGQTKCWPGCWWGICSLGPRHVSLGWIRLQFGLQCRPVCLLDFRWESPSLVKILQALHINNTPYKWWQCPCWVPIPSNVYVQLKTIMCLVGVCWVAVAHLSVNQITPFLSLMPE